VHDTTQLVLGEGAAQQCRVEEGPPHERDALGDEVRVAAGEVVQDDDVDPFGQERAHDVRADVSGSPGD
jgi:hypothetical protein